MNPVIEAAWIATGVGGLGIISTTVVAWVSARNSQRANRETLQAAADNLSRTLDAARGDRLWDAKAAAYTEAIELLRHRVRVRQEQTRQFRWDEETEQRLQTWLDSIKLPEWSSSQARLIAFASPRVLDAVEANGKADNEADRRWDHYKFLCDEAQRAPHAGVQGPDGNTTIQARNDALAAVKEAEAKADELVTAMREDLHSKPSASSTAELLPPAQRELPPPGQS